MAEDPIKKEITDAAEQGLRVAGDWPVQRVDYRTLLIAIPTDDGPRRYFQVQVKEMY